MKLGRHLFVVLIMVVLVYVGLSCMIQHMAVYSRFEKLETDEAQKNLQRCSEAIEREIFHLVSFTRDWGWWDDTVAFMSTGSQEYITANVSGSTIEDSGLNVIYFCRNDGAVAWRYCADAQGKQIELPQLPSERLSSKHILLAMLDGKDCENSIRSGIYMTDYKPLLVAAVPILTTNKQGIQAGVLIMGKFLSDDLVEHLSAQVNVPFTIAQFASFAKKQEKGAVTLKRSDDSIETSTVMADISNKGGLLINATTKRDITKQGTAAFNWSVASLCLVSLLSMLVLSIGLRKIVVKPIRCLTEHVVRVAQTDDLTTRITVSSKNEIGTLAEKFNYMTDQLQGARIKLLEESYHHGKSEQAAGMLHNVRNALTPVFTRLSTLSEQLNACPVGNIRLARGQIKDQNVDEERRADLQKYFDLAYEQLLETFENSRRQLDDICGRMHNIESFFNAAATHMRTHRCSEVLTLRQIILNASNMVPDELSQVFTLDQSHLEWLPSIKVDGVTLSNIFANILINAAESIKASKSDNGMISIRANIELKDSTQVLHLVFADNGSGLEPNALKNIFDRGFTTKHHSELSGLGLHWCANAINELGGRIWLESEGLGKGARAHVVLPVIVCKQMEAVNV
ncbi:MAG: hypothetical protein A2Y07_11340 [Planctomycetes bacterium GWF2_50_10]|nr:MAG: hypothetical protein A2Y07_11340 [Planctomycetes bacterium GWF2_50_10]